MKDNVQTGIDEMITDIHMYFKDRLERITQRINAIEEKLSEVHQENSTKSKYFGETKKIAKGAMAAAAKTVVDVELLASQEEAIGDINLDGLGLFDRLKKGISSSIEDGKDSSRIYMLMNEMYEDLTKRFDNLENKLDKLEKAIIGRSSDKERELSEGEEPKPIKFSVRRNKPLFKLNLKKNKADDLSL